MKDKRLDKLNWILALIMTPIVIVAFIILRFYYQVGFFLSWIGSVLLVIVVAIIWSFVYHNFIKEKGEK